MYDESRKPKQLERIRKSTQDKLYSRQPQLMKRLIHLMNKANIIEEETEPFLHSPEQPLSDVLEEEPKINGDGTDKRLRLKRRLNKFTHSPKPEKLTKANRISQIRQDVLWNLR